MTSLQLEKQGNAATIDLAKDRKILRIGFASALNRIQTKSAKGFAIAETAPAEEVNAVRNDN
jgi:hypothetical protein